MKRVATFLSCNFVTCQEICLGIVCCRSNFVSLHRIVRYLWHAELHGSLQDYSRILISKKMENIRTTDVVIIGGGPAGSVCGCLLKRAGVDCVIADRAVFPREKVCGGGLTYKAWRLLEKLLPDLRYDYRPITRLRLQFDDDPVSEFEAEFELRMTRRIDFDHSLVRHYQQVVGGDWITEAFVSYEELSDGQIIASFASGLRIKCRYLIAADGAHSRVRRQMFGRNPEDFFFYYEQYTEPSGEPEVFAHFSKDYFPGCFYKFPSPGRDIWGYMGPVTERDTFMKLLKRYGVPSGRLVGGYIPKRAFMSTNDHIILIGDAGGFPNRITGEGLYDAFKTAYNAMLAIVEGRPFSQTNREVFAKMRTQDKLLRFAQSGRGQRMFRWAICHPRICKLLYDIKMKRETWFR